MEAKDQAINFGVGKGLSLAMLTLLFIWQGFLANFLHRVSEVFANVEPPPNMLVFLTVAQPLIWLFMLLTAVAMFDIYRRNQFLVLNSVTVISIVTIANCAFHILTLYAGYGPVLELGTQHGG
jgi:hypothetical protein